MNLLFNKKTIRKAFLFFTLFISLIAKGQDFIWVADTDQLGSGYNNIKSIVTDSKGNTYLAGSSSGQYSSILKLDKNKNFIWVKQIFSNWWGDGGRSIILDKNENIIISGLASGLQIDLNPDPVDQYIINNPTGNTGSYIVKLDPDGNFIFGNYYPGAYVDESTLDNDGNIITTGVSGGTNVDFDAGNGVYNLNTKATDIFILKNNSNGAFIWAKNIGGNKYDYPISLVCDNLNNIILKGNFENNIAFLNTNYISDYNCNFICKINPDGQDLWLRKLGTVSGMISNEDKSVKIDNQNNIYFNTNYSSTFTPNFNNTNISFNSNSTDSILFKLDKNGEYVWHNFIFGNERQEIYSLDFDNNQNLYLLAQINGDTFINNNCNQVFPNNNIHSSNEGLLLKFNQAGDFINFKNIVGGAFSMDCDFENNIIIGGGYSGGDFDPSPSNSFFMHSSYSNGFVLKLAPCTSAVPEGDDNQLFCSSNKPTIADLKPCSEIVDWYDSSNSTLPISKNTLLIDGHIYYAAYHENCSGNIRLAVTVTITQAPQIPIASNLKFCKSDSAKLSDIVISGQNIKWYNSLIDNSILLNTTILTDDTTYYATQTVNGCESERTPTTVTVNNATKPATTSPQTFCIQQNATLNDITITTGQNIKWYDQLTAGNLLLNTTLLEDNKTYYASQTINGCESERIAIEIKIQDTPAPTGNAKQTFCSDQNPTLANITITGQDIKWYDALTNENLLPNTTALQDGITYYASQTLNSCESERLAVTISIQNTPGIPTGDTNPKFCKSENATFSNININGQNLKWYDSNTSSNPLANTTLVQNNTAYYVSQTIGCESDRLAVLVNVNDTSLPIANTPQSFCIDENAEISNIAITGQNLIWYDNAVAGNILTNTAALENRTYYVTQNNNNCESERLPVIIKIQDTQTPIADANQSFCIQQNAIINTIKINGQNIKWYNAMTDGMNLSESTPLENGITYYASQTISNCESEKTPITIEIQEATTGECINFVEELPYPKFFTPNNDEYNDTWTIDFAYLAPNTGIRIFDRYGKFIKELTINTSWDGNYFNNPLPSTDYWFVVTRLNGAEFKSHFSLKR